MPSPFKSIYAPYIQELINSRKVLGFKCNTEAVILHGFDLFAAQRGEKNLGITKELAEAWKQCKPNESSSYKAHRCSCLNQLASYLCKRAIPSYMLQLPRFKDTFTPYIFSHEQMAAIFIACDASRNKKKEWIRPLLSFQHSYDCCMQQDFG